MLTFLLLFSISQKIKNSDFCCVLALKIKALNCTTIETRRNQVLCSFGYLCVEKKTKELVEKILEKKKERGNFCVVFKIDHTI